MSSNWPQVTLKDVTSILGDGLHGTPDYDESGEYYFINGNNLNNGNIIITEKTKRASKSEYEKHKKDLNDRTILVSINGTLGNIAFYNGEKVFLGKSACYFNVKPEVDKHYIRYVLESELFQNYIHNLATGSTIKNVSLKLMRDFSLKLPPKGIQKNISRVLKDLDDKIQTNIQTNQTLEQIAQAIFKSWFVDFDPVKAKIAVLEAGGTAEQAELAAMSTISSKDEAALKQLQAEQPEAYAELAQTAALFPSKMVDSELGEIPEGWEVVRFSDIVSKYIDNRGKTPPTQETGIPLLEVKHLPDGSIKPELKTDKFVDEITYESWFRAHLESDDLIMSTVGTIGRLCMVPPNSKMTIAQNLLGLRFNPSKASPYFMYYQMNDFRFKNDIDARLVITVQASIKRKDLETIDLLSASIELQKKFESFVKPLVLSQQSNENLQLAELRDSLLPKLLSGELPIPETDEANA